jgi:hypothetical protein
MSFFSFYFFLHKIGEQEDGAGPASCIGTSVRGVGKKVGKGIRRVNMVQIPCTHDNK